MFPTTIMSPAHFSHSLLFICPSLHLYVIPCISPSLLPTITSSRVIPPSFILSLHLPLLRSSGLHRSLLPPLPLSSIFLPFFETPSSQLTRLILSGCCFVIEHVGSRSRGTIPSDLEEQSATTHQSRPHSGKVSVGFSLN